MPQRGEVGTDHHELELRSAAASAAAQVLRREQEGLDAAEIGELRPQPGNDGLGRDAALVERLQADLDLPAIERVPSAGHAHL